MLIHEACKATKLTKRAIEYYTEQGLIFPAVLENGYRDFREADLQRLKKISVLRKLGVGTAEIREILSDETGEALHRAATLKDLSVKREQAKKAILDKLSCGAKESEISEDLQAIEDSAAISEKLLDAFPGYYGRYLCLHFARFLNQPIQTQKQKNAYERILSFLDDAPQLEFPPDVQQFLTENAKDIGTENISFVLENTKKSIENPENFLSENKEILEQYIEFRQSEEYKSSMLYQLRALLMQFNKASGYSDVFLPAMKELSPAYANYQAQLQIANEKLLKQYPDAAKLEKE